MHNKYAIFAKYLGICKHFGRNLTNEKGNEPRRGVDPRFSNLEVITLNLAAESIGIDSENYLLRKNCGVLTDFQYGLRGVDTYIHLALRDLAYLFRKRWRNGKVKFFTV